ncbi:MAG: hypothetical protein ACTSRG_04455 [Candidatus Helarchaeota archaeon]
MYKHGVGYSKHDFLYKGIQVGTDSLPRGMMWIQFYSLNDLKRVAEMLGIKVINKRGNDYVFADKGTIYYCQE